MGKMRQILVFVLFIIFVVGWNFAEVDKNAPQIVSDGLVLFTITGAGKVVFSGVEAGLAGAAKLAKKIDLLDSKTHGSTGALNTIAELPKTKIEADVGIDYGSHKNFAPIQKDFQTGLNNLILKFLIKDLLLSHNLIRQDFYVHSTIHKYQKIKIIIHKIKRINKV